MSETGIKEMPPLMILCGGKGTRLRDVTELLPKPMVPIGEYPIVWHIMRYFSTFGVRRFVLCLGYKKEEFTDYFLNLRARASDITLLPGRGEVIPHGEFPESDWEITLADTGAETMTGGRIRIAAEKYILDKTDEFFLTYGDGVADVDIGRLLAFHRGAGKLLTLTAIHPEGRFGELVIDGNLVSGFTEKPARVSGYVNGGFMVMRSDFVRRYLCGRADDYLERAPMSEAQRDGELAAFRHEGFWQCMDTQREHALLNDLWRSGKAPWRKW